MRDTGGFYFRELWECLDHPLTAMEMEEVFESGTRMGLRILMPYWDADSSKCCIGYRLTF